MNEEIPDQVLSVVRAAVRRIRDLADALAQGRRADCMFDGGGRYEADAWCNAMGAGRFQQFKDAVNHLHLFKRIATENGVDGEAVLKELGLPSEEELTLSEAAKGWIQKEPSP